MNGLIKRLVSRNTLLFLISLNLIIPFLFVSFPVGFSMEGDALDYRYSIVKMIHEQNAIPTIRWTYNDDYPPLGEILFALSLKISPWGPRIISAISYSSFSLAILFLARLILPEVWIFLTMLISMTSTLVTTQDNLWMVDLMASSFSLWAIYFVTKAVKFPLKDRQFLLFAGLFSGLAMLTRYTQLPVMVMLAFAWFIWTLACSLSSGVTFRTALLKRIHVIFYFLVPALCVFSPWALRNLYVNHNPLFPFFISLWGGLDLNQMRAHEITGMFANHCGFGRSLYDFVLLPFRFAFYVDAFDYSVGPYFLMFLPLCLLHGAAHLKKRNSSSIWGVELFPAFLTLCLTFAWFMGSRQGRFLSHVIPCIVLSGISAIYFWLSLDKRPWVRSSFIVILAILGLAGTGKHFVKHKNELLDQWDILVSNFQESKLLRTIHYNQKDVIDWFNQKSDGGKVLLIERTGNVSLLDRPYILAYPHVYSTSFLDFRSYGDPASYYKDLSKAEVRFLYVLDDAGILKVPRLGNGSSPWTLVYAAPSGGRIYELKGSVP